MSGKVGGTSGIGDDPADLTGPWTERDGLLRGGEDLWSYRGRDRVGLGTGLAVIGRPA